jgi:hypothetical protein
MSKSPIFAFADPNGILLINNKSYEVNVWQLYTPNEKSIIFARILVDDRPTLKAIDVYSPIKVLDEYLGPSIHFRDQYHNEYRLLSDQDIIEVMYQIMLSAFEFRTLQLAV